MTTPQPTPLPADELHTTCTLCNERVRRDRVDAYGRCVNCLALGKQND